MRSVFFQLTHTRFDGVITDTTSGVAKALGKVKPTLLVWMWLLLFLLLLLLRTSNWVQIVGPLLNASCASLFHITIAGCAIEVGAAKI